MELFTETISLETYNKIQQFLATNASQELDFYVYKDGFELYRQGIKELFNSTASFRAEFDSLINYFQENLSGVDGYKERMLMEEANRKLTDPYSRFIKNQEVWDMLGKISHKTIRND